MEATSIYGDSLVCALREDGALGRYQRHIHVLNPKQVRKFKDAYPDLPKNDYVDAFVIADHLRFGRIASEVYMDDYRYRSLQTLTRARFDTVQNLTREKQRYLFLKCSGFAQDKSISNTSATTLTLMEAFETVDKLANTDLETLTAFVAAAGHGRSLIQKLPQMLYSPLPEAPTDCLRRSTIPSIKPSLFLLLLCGLWKVRSRFWTKPLSSSLRSSLTP